MIEVNITKKLKEKKFNELITFLYSLSSEICFTSFHQYHLDEDSAVEALNEYKQRCKEKHREIQTWYEKKEPFLMKTLAKLKVKDEEEFLEYKENIYQSDMALCKKMDEILDGLVNDNNTRDYKDVFPEIKDSLKEIEIHMYDIVSVSLMPLDLLIYDASDEVLKVLIDMKKLSSPVLINKKEHVFLINPVFCNNEEAFAVVYSERGMITIVMTEEEYKRFKLLKIRHKKEVVSDTDK